MSKKKYCCDVCGMEINDPDLGVFLWNMSWEDHYRIKHLHNARIVHKNKCDNGVLPMSAEISDVEQLEFWIERMEIQDDQVLTMDRSWWDCMRKCLLE